MLEKQYIRIIRWVNRAQTMSADGNFSDAILDVECARAELDDARQELLLCHKEGRERKQLPKALLAVSGALFAVLVWSVPLHRSDPHVFVQREDVAQRVRLSSAADESARLNPAQALSVVPQTPTAVVAAVGEEQTRIMPEEMRVEAISQPVLPKTANVRKNVRLASQRGAARLSAADMLRLTEVGRRALQKDRSVLVLEFN